MTPVMTNVKRITANLPEELLAEAMEATGAGITETLIRGLELVQRASAYDKAMRLKGKLQLDIDLDLSRGRPAP